MVEEILINVTPQETRVAVIEHGVTQELHVERASARGLVGNIYVGRVLRVLPGMQSAFIDIGGERAAFLHVADIRATIAALKKNGTVITQGPVTFGDGHVSVFFRDPDRNVIELRARLDPGVAETIEGLTFYDPKG